MEQHTGTCTSAETGTNQYARMLTISNPLREPVFRSAIRKLNLPLGSRGLDAGCGIGLQTILLSEAVGPSGLITGLDRSGDFLAHARELSRKTRLSERISFREGDVRKLPFEDDTFDWVWSADCVGYAPMEPLSLVKELVRVVRPGGSVAILAWSFERLLPGYPLLEAHLNATTSGIAPFIQGTNPNRHFLRALGWFHKAGLEETAVQTFVGDARAPLSEDLRASLVVLFHMRWSGVEEELPNSYKQDYKRLCLSESPDFIVDLNDYYAFITYTMFSGTVAHEAP
jgi:demethylmenaquinone methyltransferase / 2-methoxy-6-polyprenyl-1,4-benzoquinol methylase